MLANLVAAKAPPWDPEAGLPKRRRIPHADPEDRRALAMARDAAHLAAIGRMIYGALVEQLREVDGVSKDDRFRSGLVAGIERHGTAAASCDLAEVFRFMPQHSGDRAPCLVGDPEYVRDGQAENFAPLLESYRLAGRKNEKGSRRARLCETGHAKDRRAEWLPERHTLHRCTIGGT